MGFSKIKVGSRSTPQLFDRGLSKDLTSFDDGELNERSQLIRVACLEVVITTMMENQLQYGSSIRLPYPEIAGDIEAQDKIFSQVTGDERTEAWRYVVDDTQYKVGKMFKEEITISVGELLETM